MIPLEPESADSADARRTYDITEEPIGDTYRQLVSAAAASCESFLLVIRPMYKKAYVSLILRGLQPFLLGVSSESEWPGTRLFGHVATVYRYAATQAAAEYLAGAAERLYAWVQPDLPEDPCFLRSDGSPWLVTIAHEEDAYLVLSEAENAALLARIPTLALRVAQPRMFAEDQPT